MDKNTNTFMEESRIRFGKKLHSTLMAQYETGRQEEANLTSHIVLDFMKEFEVALQDAIKYGEEKGIKEVQKFLDYAYSKNFDQNIGMYQAFIEEEILAKLTKPSEID